jgi:coiled-coil domain-containing protein 61
METPCASKWSKRVMLLDGVGISAPAVSELLLHAHCQSGPENAGAVNCQPVWPCADIEDITTKTGNFKKFPIFVKMLLSAVKQASESVFVDLLTYQDLEVLKARKAAPNSNQQPGGPAAARPALPPNNKRYLILTYAAEFDRVHYPLPLIYEENPDPQQLKSIICKLRAEVEVLQQQAAAGGRRGVMGAGGAANMGEVQAELRHLREENAALKQHVHILERGTTAQRGSDPGSLEIRELARELKMVGWWGLAGRRRSCDHPHALLMHLIT